MLPCQEEDEGSLSSVWISEFHRAAAGRSGRSRHTDSVGDLWLRESTENGLLCARAEAKKCIKVSLLCFWFWVFLFFFTYKVSLFLFVYCFSDRALKGSHHAWDNKLSLNEGGTYKKEVDPARWCEWCS